MNGKFKSMNTKAVIAVTAVFFGILPLFCLFCQSDAAIIVVSVVPMLIGTPPLIHYLNLTAAYTADEKGLTIKLGSSEHSYRYGDIEQIGCEYVGSEGGRATAKLTIKDTSGNTFSVVENCPTNVTALLNDPSNTKRPQLFQLCDFVKQAKGAAV